MEADDRNCCDKIFKRQICQREFGRVQSRVAPIKQTGHKTRWIEWSLVCYCWLELDTKVSLTAAACHRPSWMCLRKYADAKLGHLFTRDPHNSTRNCRRELSHLKISINTYTSNLYNFNDGPWSFSICVSVLINKACNKEWNSHSGSHYKPIMSIRYVHHILNIK